MPRPSLNRDAAVAMACIVAASAILISTFALSGSSRTTRRVDPADQELLAREGPNWGAPRAQARYTVVVFTDFQCRYCRALHDTLRTLVQRHPNVIAITYRHSPLRQNTRSYGAALSAECAFEQGRFAQFADEVFARQDSLGRTTWNSIALASGIRDSVSFEKCRAKEQTHARVRADIETAAGLGIKGTPLIVASEGTHEGILTVDALAQLIGVTRQQ
jgi:protein-disulfide isomerase